MLMSLSCFIAGLMFIISIDLVSLLLEYISINNDESWQITI